MIPSALVAFILPAALAYAQGSPSSPRETLPAYTVQPNSVDVNLRIAWCRAQQNTCLDLCNARTATNTCDPNNLKYLCECFSGQTPKISEYAQTLPSLLCEEWRKQCVQSHPNDLAGQNNCLSVTCGEKKAASPISSGGTVSISQNNNSGNNGNSGNSNTGPGTPGSPGSLSYNQQPSSSSGSAPTSSSSDSSNTSASSTSRDTSSNESVGTSTSTAGAAVATLFAGTGAIIGFAGLAIAAGL